MNLPGLKMFATSMYEMECRSLEPPVSPFFQQTAQSDNADVVPLAWIVYSLEQVPDGIQVKVERIEHPICASEKHSTWTLPLPNLLQNIALWQKMAACIYEQTLHWKAGESGCMS